MNIQAIATSLIPVLLAAIGFLITSINGIENRMYQVESKMMQLISPDGQGSDAMARARDSSVENWEGGIYNS